MLLYKWIKSFIQGIYFTVYRDWLRFSLIGALTKEGNWKVVLKLRNFLLNGKPPTWYLPTWPIRLLISQWSWLVVRLILVKQINQQFGQVILRLREQSELNPIDLWVWRWLSWWVIKIIIQYSCWFSNDTRFVVCSKRYTRVAAQKSKASMSI